MRDKNFIENVLRELNSYAIEVLDYEDALNAIFTKVAMSNKYIEYIVFTDETGLVIASYPSRDRRSQKYIEEILGPSAAIMVMTARKISESSELLDLKAVMVEGEKGSLIAASLQNRYVLALQYSKDSPRGLIVRDFKFLMNRVREVVSGYG